ncbi:MULTISPECIES: EAL domain-containing protein [unclassified Thioalkalivibrio]|uniref:EAL domain-containing protein n=1 Tax=unclassified Thioalkalivibrio TaxID=2621013 RepID=UPI002101B9FD|nr:MULTISPECIES: EAL domain-containing protein [unclassified Thioalkalivibrio]
MVLLARAVGGRIPCHRPLSTGCLRLALLAAHAIGDGVITTDLEGRLNYLNPVAEHLTGWNQASAYNQPLASVSHRLPQKTLKIDGSFVRDMAEDRVSRAMVESIHHIGRVIGVKTVAERVSHESLMESMCRSPWNHALFR